MTLSELSHGLADIVEAAGRSVVRLEGRRRGPASGSVWNADGLVVAADHAVEWDEVGVGLPDGATAKARVVGRDPGTDVALLKVEGGSLMPPRWAPELASRAGELVLVVSRPGRAPRARLGLLHAVGGEWRTGAGSRLEAHLESDVAVQLGFSGSLLIGADGRALGMNTTGLLRGASMAVPAATLTRVVGALAQGGKVRRGYQGVGTQSVALTQDLETRTGQSRALLVVSVQPDSPAARAGILLGDALVSVEDAPIRHPADLLPFLDAERVGRELQLRLLRAGDLRDARITLGERA
jgi:S1-C subfamily serine protease